MKEVLYERINAGEKDYFALVTRLKQASVDLVYFGGLHTEAGLIICQMRDQALHAAFLTGDGVLSGEFVGIAGSAAEGTLITFTPNPRRNLNADDVVKRLRAKGIEPEAYTLYSYAAVEVLARSAAALGTNDPRKIAEFLHSGSTVNTAVGDLSYDSKGDLSSSNYVVYTWKRNAGGRLDYAANRESR